MLLGQRLTTFVNVKFVKYFVLGNGQLTLTNVDLTFNPRCDALNML